MESQVLVSREEALDRFRALFRDLRSLPEDLGENPFPASLEVTLQGGPPIAGGGASGSSPPSSRRRASRRCSTTCSGSSGSPPRVRLVRGAGAFLGGILVLAGVFTISNVIRLTVYARQDELDIMRLVGATQAYVKGPFVVEGMIQGGLGGLLAGPAAAGPRSGSSREDRWRRRTSWAGRRCSCRPRSCSCSSSGGWRWAWWAAWSAWGACASRAGAETTRAWNRL